MDDLNSAANQFFSRREAMRPHARTWAKHIGLLLLTFFTVTLAGTLEPFGIIPLFGDKDVPEPQTWTELGYMLLAIPGQYFGLVVDAIRQLFTDFKVFKYGISFSLSLIFILLSHELGHYIACRIYGVDATLPYFLPTPPLIGPAGTFGAFIKIVSPIQSRKAVFDIGVAGPIAGFVALIPIALIAFLTYEYDTTNAEAAGGTIVFSDSLFYKILAWIFGVNLQNAIKPNPFYFAAWVGLLVTALNLIPSGQLDGGHAVYAVFNSKIHRWIGRIAFVVMVILSISGWFYFNSPSGFLFAVILFFMMRVGHPAPLDDSPLDFKRKLIAVLTLLIFILSFMPFPIQIR
jgi:membrane-associated protease RseP (regulator of RpoE activity)